MASNTKGTESDATISDVENDLYLTTTDEFSDSSQAKDAAGTDTVGASVVSTNLFIIYLHLVYADKTLFI
jgi:hypothetical protein